MGVLLTKDLASIGDGRLKGSSFRESVDEDRVIDEVKHSCVIAKIGQENTLSNFTAKAGETTTDPVLRVEEVRDLLLDLLPRLRAGGDISSIHELFSGVPESRLKN